jgi:RNA polymerase sigma-70 factor, ECF subfamily
VAGCSASPTAAARRPIHGAQRAARFLLALGRTARGEVTSRIVQVNGEPALLVSLDGTLVVVMVLEVADGRIHTIRSIRNPDKLTGLRAATP